MQENWYILSFQEHRLKNFNQKSNLSQSIMMDPNSGPRTHVI